MRATYYSPVKLASTFLKAATFTSLYVQLSQDLHIAVESGFREIFAEKWAAEAV